MPCNAFDDFSPDIAQVIAEFSLGFCQGFPAKGLSREWQLSHTDTAEGFPPSPVLTGEGRDEGELERIGRVIHQRRVAGVKRPRLPPGR